MDRNLRIMIIVWFLGLKSRCEQEISKFNYTRKLNEPTNENYRDYKPMNYSIYDYNKKLGNSNFYTG